MQKAKVASAGSSKLNRRLLLGGSVAALGIGVGAFEHLQAQNHAHPRRGGAAGKAQKGPDYHGRNAELVTTTRACLQKGEACLRHCVASLSSGDTSLVDCLKTVTAMLPICQALERYAVIDARHLRELVRLCMAVNAECEAECRRHADHHDACKDCADACAACISACTKVAERAARAPFLDRNFQLTTHSGAVWRSASCAGRPAAVIFGYTHCPAVCPTTLLKVSNALAALGPAAGALQVLFVTVDPERDTADLLRQYLSSFDARITGLTGRVGEVDSLAGAFGAHVARGATASGRAIDHTTSIYLLDRTGYIVSELPDGASEEQQAAALRSLVG
jgi:protein SCO1